MRRQLALRVLVCTLVTLVMAGAGVSASTHLGAGAARTACARYVIVDTRGSGDPINKLSRPAARFVATWKGLHKGSRVQVVTNPYPAPDWKSFAGAGLKLPGSYYRSVVEGKQWLANFLGLLAQQDSPCSKRRRILLVGYSQGAQVTGDVVQKRGVKLASGVFDQLLGVVLFGDTYFNSADPVDRSDFEHGRNGWLGKRGVFEESIQPYVLSYCHAHDPVCQGPLHNGEWLTSQHTNYEKLGEPEEAAKHFSLNIEPSVFFQQGWSIKAQLVANGAATVLVPNAVRQVHDEVHMAALAVTDSAIYWSDAGGIWRADRDGSNRRQIVALREPGIRALVVTDDYLLWATWKDIWRSALDGSRRKRIWDKGGTSDIASDGGRVFYVSADTCAVGSLNVDGSHANTSFIRPDYNPCLIQHVTVVGRSLFWDEGATGTIGRAGLDGSRIEPRWFDTGSKAPLWIRGAGDVLVWRYRSRPDWGSTLGKLRISTRDQVVRNWVRGGDDVSNDPAVQAAYIGGFAVAP
jgi:hypothetical protein